MAAGTSWASSSASRAVLAVQPQQDDDEDREHDEDHPRAVGELGDGDDEGDDARQRGADAVDHETPPPARLAQPEVVLGHPRLGQREPGEHTDGVEGDERGHLGAGGDHERHRGTSQHQHPVGVDETVPALRHLPREEAVAGLEAGEAREVREAGVGRHHEDQHRPGLERVVQDLAEGPAAVHRLTDLRDDRRRPTLERRHLDGGREHRQAEEHDPEAGAHEHQRLAGVPPRRLLEGGHAVRDGLHARDGRTAGRERVEARRTALHRRRGRRSPTSTGCGPPARARAREGRARRTSTARGRGGGACWP